MTTQSARSGVARVTGSAGADARPTEHCPHCHTDLRGRPMDPKHFVHSDDCPLPEGDKYFPGRCFCLPYGDLAPDDRFYCRKIGIEVPGVYDGVLFWLCPDCSGRWHRWPEGHGLRDRADKYMAEVP